jgi:UDP-N-acetylglucosamine transferase subunit ALG13
MTDLPLIFATVGTDVHPFDRMADWVDAWLQLDGEPRARCVMQTGTSKTPKRAEHSPYLGYADMESLVQDARVVVCHGGPGTIMLASSLGKIPIVMPRSSALGEHVDDHQVAFCKRIAADGAILLANNEDEFRAHIEVVLRGDVPPPRMVSNADPAVTTARFEELVDGLFQPHAEVAKHVEPLAPGRKA